MKFKLRSPYDFLSHKVLKTIMRTFIFLFCTVIFSFNTESGFSQDAKIEIDEDKSVSVEQIFNLIKTQTDYEFVYRYDLIKNSPKILLKKGIIKASSLLEKSLNTVSCTYEFTDNTVIVKRKPNLPIQEKEVKGTVKDEKGIPLSGVTVYIADKNNDFVRGINTDFDGNYSIKAKVGDILIFSFIGYKTVEKEVVSSVQRIDVTLEEDINVLNEVVITALGIKKRPKETTYAVQTLKSKDLTKTKALNPVTTLAGKVAGLQINTSSNGVNPSTRILLRGSRSLQGNNRALIVIDGVVTNRTDDLEHINPDDIESITILKGANAAALYGAGAVNGVVLVNTKKGEGKFTFNYSSATEIQTVAYLPELQEEFGVGTNGNLLPLGNVNYGPRYDGQLVDISETYDDGRVLQTTFSPIKNRNKNFFDTGVTTRHGISVGSGNDNGDLFMSIGQANVAGITPKNKYERTNFRFRANKKVGKLKVGGNLAFSRENSDVSSGSRRDGSSIYSILLNTPLHVPIEDFKNWRNGEFSRNEVSFFRYNENPYFLIDTQRSKSNVSEFSFTADIEYQFNDNLKATLRPHYQTRTGTTTSENGEFGYDFQVNDAFRNPAEYDSRISEALSDRYLFSTDFILNYKKDLKEDLTLETNLGYNLRVNRFKSLTLSGFGLTVPDFYSISTITSELSGNENVGTNRRMGFYGDATLGYRDYLFLYVSGRNDIVSNLPAKSRSFFYPSVGLSFVASDAFPDIVKPKGLSYLKLSGNIARVGSGSGATILSNFRVPRGFPYGDLGGLELNRPFDPNLSPEFTTSIEASVEFGLFNNRLNANITGYKTNTTDQLATITTPSTSGASSINTNVGEVQNLGLEIGLNGKIINNKDFSWDLALSATKYKNEVVELANGSESVIIGIDPSNFTSQVIAKVGSPFPLISTRDYERDDEGRVIVGDDGNPLISNFRQDQGQSTPSFIMGLNSTFKYKNFSLNTTMSYRTGHVFSSSLARELDILGLTKHGVSSNREAFVFPNSVYSNGSGGYVENTNRLTTGGGEDFFTNNYANVGSNYVYDATTIKIREIALSYDFDRETLKPIGLSALTFGLYGRNLFMFRPAANTFVDPEFSLYEAGNTIGISSSRQGASTRQIGFSLNVKF